MSRLGVAVALSLAAHAGVAAAVLAGRSAEPLPALFVDLTEEDRAPDPPAGARPGPGEGAGREPPAARVS
ncbi:MAG TPA: hypothetical protein VNO23_16000, partial [Candidatus Binatia bacterium]|nr:hypothetical protein [Candidatus Binatia bacterium]